MSCIVRYSVSIFLIATLIYDNWYCSNWKKSFSRLRGKHDLRIVSTYNKSVLTPEKRVALVDFLWMHWNGCQFSFCFVMRIVGILPLPYLVEMIVCLRYKYNSAFNEHANISLLSLPLSFWPLESVVNFAEMFESHCTTEPTSRPAMCGLRSQLVVYLNSTSAETPAYKVD